VRIVINPSEDKDRPYIVTFYNLALGDRGGSKAVELKHSTSGYIWIEPGERVAHLTDFQHPFTIRNFNKSDIVTVTLLPMHDEL
jgi:hypothetical protein